MLKLPGIHRLTNAISAQEGLCFEDQLLTETEFIQAEVNLIIGLTFSKEYYEAHDS